jgi:hypothetical protein
VHFETLSASLCGDVFLIHELIRLINNKKKAAMNKPCVIAAKAQNIRNAFVSSLLATLIFSIFCVASAQSYGRIEQTQSNLGSYYYFVQPGAPTVRVSVMGPVRYPGVYELGKGADLLQVLSLCGGPDPGRVEFVNRQRTTIKVFRPSESKDKPFYESLLEKALTGQVKSPELAEGDIITVDVAAWRRFDWRDILTLVNVVNTVIIIIIAIKD